VFLCRRVFENILVQTHGRSAVPAAKTPDCIICGGRDDIEKKFIENKYHFLQILSPSTYLSPIICASRCVSVGLFCSIFLF
jgi:hypothetical protein